MKTYAASVSLLAFGTSILGAVESTALTSQQSTKPWSVSASLRGFYDSNINSAPSAYAQKSGGFQISPTINYGFAGERTSVNFGYLLAANWYDNPVANWDSPWELTQTLQGALNHTFNPRLNVALKDSFVIGQEPDVIQVANTPFATSQTISGNNTRNYASIDFNYQATSLLGFQLGYGNLLYNYDDSGPGSNSALLDRMENLVHLDSRWTLQPQTVGILGYAFSQVGYTANEIIGFSQGVVRSNDRNSRGNTFYAGAEHAFTPELAGQIKAGVQVFDYYNDPNSSTKASPYVTGSMTYMYRPTSSVTGGLSLMRSPTDTFSAQPGGGYVLDTESLVLYGSWVHEIMPRLYGNLNGSFQQSRYNGGSVDGENSFYYRVGVSLAYEFTKYFSASLGYNWDQSDAPSQLAYQDYNRNRVYLGVTAAY